MDLLFDHYKKTGYLHHAHIIEGVYGEVAPLLLDAITQHLGIETKSNPDLTVIPYDSLGINEARALSDMQTRAAFGGARKIFIIGAQSFTHEAQNALLKTFEDPTVGTHFFLILPHIEMLLPTLLSRVLVVRGVGAISEDEAKTFAERFLSNTLAEQFALIKKLTEHKKGESVDREMIHRIMDHLERILYTRTAGRRDEAVSNIFREIYQAKTYLADRGSSPKMLLENIAISSLSLKN